jgi:predicted HTH transcriptional regulator
VLWGQTPKTPIERRDLSKFIGLKENQYFEAKSGKRYNFDNPEDRYKFAKDVSSFANSEGGYLIIGLNSEPLETEATDIIKSQDLIPNEHINTEKMKGVLREYIHPRIDGLKVKWIESIENKSKGIVYIFIPQQKEDKKYFLIKNIYEDGKKIRNFVFGISTRKDSSNEPLGEKELYRLIIHGKNPISERLTVIEQKLDISLRKLDVLLKHKEIIKEPSPSDLLDDRIKKIRDLED